MRTQFTGVPTENLFKVEVEASRVVVAGRSCLKSKCIYLKLASIHAATGAVLSSVYLGNID